MTDITTGELLELLECRTALELTLRRLDRAGAGIAAIHVDAAIHQLTQNLDWIEVASDDGSPPDLIKVYDAVEAIH